MTDQHQFVHETVLLHQLVDALNLQRGQCAIDCTAGGGGHTQLLLERVGREGLVIAFDRDPRAITVLQERFAEELAAGTLQLVNEPFSNISQRRHDRPVNGICADIGVSSPQLDQDDRGFSFMRDGPLDMRMDQSSGTTAADLVNGLEEKELADLIYQLGEEPKSRVIARLIVNARKTQPFTSTLQLAQFIDKNIHYQTKSRTHKATRTFQALRIAVNSELDELQTLIRDGFALLAPGGRFAIVSFHSLEDRIIKHKFREFCGKFPRSDHALRHLPQKDAPVHARIVKPFPLVPPDEETRTNPRARSAKLRCIEKVEAS